MAGYDGASAPVAAGNKKFKDMSTEEFKERGFGDMFAQVQGMLQEHPDLTEAAMAKITQLGTKANNLVTDVPTPELQAAGLADSSGNLLASIQAKMAAYPKMTVAMALAACGLATAAGVFAYRKFCSDTTPVSGVSAGELKERGLMDKAGNMLASVKAKMDENPDLDIAGALAATGLVVAGGIALPNDLAPDSTLLEDIPNEEMQQRGLMDSSGNMLEPVKAAMTENPKMTVGAALAATGLVIAGGIALHHSSAADTNVADMSNEQLQQVGLVDPEKGGLLSSIKKKLKANPKMSIAAALAAAATVGVGAYAINSHMTGGGGRPGKHGKGKKGDKGKEKKDKGDKGDKGGKEKKDKGDKEKKDKGDKEKKEKGEKKEKQDKGDKGGKSKDLAGPDDYESSDSETESSSEPDEWAQNMAQ